MTYAKHVGRIGALAVVLGVGTALAAGYGSGVAHADTDGSTQPAKTAPPDSSDEPDASASANSEDVSTNDSFGDSVDSSTEDSPDESDDSPTDASDDADSSATDAISDADPNSLQKDSTTPTAPTTGGADTAAGDSSVKVTADDRVPPVSTNRQQPALPDAAVVPAEQGDSAGGRSSANAQPGTAVKAVLSDPTPTLMSPSTDPADPADPPLGLALLAMARRDIEQSVANRGSTEPGQDVTLLQAAEVSDPASLSITANDVGESPLADSPGLLSGGTDAARVNVTVDKPDAPTGPGVTPTADAVMVSWAPPDDSDSPITRFSLRHRLHGEAWTFADDAPASATAAVIAGLAPDTAYEFAVRASNVFGNSPWSNSALTLTTVEAGNPKPAPDPDPNPDPDPEPEPEPPAPGNVLWQDKFDTASVGRLTKATGDAVFGPTAAPTGGDTYVNGSILTDPAGGRFLRHSIPAGQLGAFIVSPNLSRDVEHAVLEYDVRFDENFDWRWGGKIPGLVGVAPGNSIYAPTSGRANRALGFSTRLMWHGRGDDGSRPFQGKLGPIPAGADNDLVTYIYAPSPSAGFNSYGWHTNLGSEMQRGQWHRIKMEVELNSVGSRDGVFKVWVDDRLRYSASDWEYRTRSDVKIDAVLHDIHRGGGTTPPSWVSSRNSYIDMRNMVVREL